MSVPISTRLEDLYRKTNNINTTSNDHETLNSLLEEIRQLKQRLVELESVTND